MFQIKGMLGNNLKAQKEIEKMQGPLVERNRTGAR